jgi:uncharacterized protein
MTAPARPPRTVRCPQCGTAVEWTPESRYRPFCSQRCKMIDLGAWAAEAYRVPVAEKDDDTSIDDQNRPAD